MCGITGLSVSRHDAGQLDSVALATALLLEIESRGRDATGVAWRRNDDTWYMKNDVPASRFIADVKREVHVHTRTVIGHTRYATLGSPSVNANNHPIYHGNIVGVHNGVVRNHHEVFDFIDAKRDATVDSEAIFALLHHGTSAWPGSRPADLLSLIEGSAAVAWINTGDSAGTVHLARVFGSPLHVAYTEGGSLVFASTPVAIRNAFAHTGHQCSRTFEIPEGTHLVVRHGRIIDVQRFDVSASTHYVRPNYDRPSRFESPTRKVDHGTSQYTDALTGAWDWK